MARPAPSNATRTDNPMLERSRRHHGIRIADGRRRDRTGLGNGLGRGALGPSVTRSVPSVTRSARLLRSLRRNVAEWIVSPISSAAPTRPAMLGDRTTTAAKHPGVERRRTNGGPPEREPANAETRATADTMENMSDIDTTPATIPVEAGGDGPARSRARSIAIGVVAVIVVSSIAGGFLYRTPWVVIRPGSAIETEPRIAVSGTDVFPSEGEILLTTISTGRRELSVWEWAWVELFEPDAWIRDADEVFGGRSRDERRAQDLERMRLSQSNATLVALSVLGYEVFEEAGALVVTVSPGSPSDGALEPNDVVVGLDGSPIDNGSALVDALTPLTPGESVVLQVRRGDVVTEVDVTLGERPDDAARPFLGIELETQVIDAPLPFDIEIDAGSVGGPSAGAAFTLALLDLLTEGELTGGHRVAVTGTMELSGCIGNIGGLAQKVVAARRSGADTFIVPAAQLPEIEGVDAGSMEIVGAAGLDDALAILADRGGDISTIPDFELACSD